MTNKLSDKDKKDWEKFVKGDEKIENKDKEFLNKNKIYFIQKIKYNLVFLLMMDSLENHL